MDLSEPALFIRTLVLVRLNGLLVETIVDPADVDIFKSFFSFLVQKNKCKGSFCPRNTFYQNAFHHIFIYYSRFTRIYKTDVCALVCEFNPFSNKSWFLRVCSTSLLKTMWEKEKLLVTNNFFFSHGVFLSILSTFRHFYQIWNFRLQTLSVWKTPKFVVWERVKASYSKSNQNWFPDASWRVSLLIHHTVLWMWKTSLYH